MTKSVAALLFVAAAACGGGEKKVEQPKADPVEPVAQEPVEPVKPPEPPPFEMAIGELVIYDGAEPGFKLHADGTSEVAVKVTTTPKKKKAKPVTKVEWKPGPTFKADGSIEKDGKAVGKFGWDGITDLETGQILLAYTVDDTSLTVKTPDGAEVKLVLEGEGMKVVGGPMDGRVDKLEAADDKIKRTGLLITAIMALAAPSPEPAPEAKGAP